MKTFSMLFLLVTSFFVGTAQTGFPDATFNGTGISFVGGSGEWPASEKSLAVQSDGKILVGGSTNGISYPTECFLQRLNKNGSLDQSFFYTGFTLDYNIHGLKVQPDGKILLNGNPAGLGFNISGIVRTNSNGQIDSSFAVDGTFELPDFLNQSNSTIFVRPNGRILFISSVNNDLSILYQLLPNGKLDSSFGINGQKLINLKITGHNSCLLLNNGKLLMTGIKKDSLTNRLNIYTVMRITTSGQIDNNYGINGKVMINSSYFEVKINSIRSDINGNIFLSGNECDSINNNYKGTRFINLGTAGLINTTWGNNGNIFLSRVAGLPLDFYPQPNGGFIVLGNSENGRYLISRVNKNGMVDSLFGKYGAVSINSGEGYADYFSASTLQPDGKIIVAGDTWGVDFNQNYFSIVSVLRYDFNVNARNNTLVVKSFFDVNKNGIKDANEPWFSQGAATTIKPGVDTIISNFRNTAMNLYLDTGTYKTKLAPYLPYYNIVPAIYNSIFTTYFKSDTVSFAMQPIAGKRDVSINIIPITTALPTSPLAYDILFKNQGTDTIATVTIKFLKSNKLAFDSATITPAGISGNTITWMFSNIKPQKDSIIRVYLKTKAGTVLGDSLISTAKITSNKPDLTPTDDTATIKQIINNSIEANDKTEIHGGKISTTQIAVGDYLHYTVRFQNIDTINHLNLNIIDNLSSKLDWNSYQTISASHNYTMTMKNGKCLFSFPSINLTDSSINKARSTGNITFRIKPKTTVALGDTIYNNALIYFDSDLPVTTKYSVTRIIAETFPLELLTFTAQKQGKTNLLQWQTAQEINVDHFIVERSLNGSPDSYREFNGIGNVKAGLSNYSFTDNNPLKATNYYRLKMMDRDGQFTYSPIRSINNSGTFSVSIYPNPAKDNLQIQISLTPSPLQKRGAIQLQIISQDGKVLLSQNTSATTGSILRSINTSNLAKGSYFLKVTIADKDEQVLKFEKQ